ncbi:type II secretion system secretin GspD [Zhongshania marina]|uniref:type II secretion system secretin GspD n=1 Tax=Zhongshania marina TaxID=2304603 RepID=UPI00130506A3|nr:type II secretion system secretin GspD [Marortus luteolus]
MEEAAAFREIPWRNCYATLPRDNNKARRDRRATQDVIFQTLSCFCLAGIILLGLFHPLPAFSKEASDSQIAVELEDVDIRDFVRWCAEITGQTIVVHPQVSGKVTVISGKQISSEEAYQVFLATLQVHGFTVIRSDDVLKVIPSAQAKENEIPLLEGDSSAQSEDIVVKILSVSSIPAREVVELLKPISSATAYLAAYAPTNALIVADRRSKVLQLEKIIGRIDQAAEIEVQIIPLVFANADEVSATIRELIGSAKQQGNGPEFRLSVDRRSNSILVSGDAMTKAQVRDLVNQMDKPVKGTGNTSVIRLQYAEAGKLVPILETVSGSIQRGEKDQRLANVDIKISAHEPLNSLIITAPPSVMETMRAVIQELDARRAQVLVEAIIVEVSEDLSKDLGVEWQTNLETDDAVFGSVSLLPNAISDTINISGGAASGGAGLSLGYFRNGSLRAMIRALEGSSEANILSTPSIVALDNEEAKILVGSNVPFVTGSLQRAGDENPFQTIQRQDIGVTLNIRPRINNRNSLTLDISQKVESIGQSSVQTADIITNKRELSTRVLIENDDVLVLGGLIRDEVMETVSKVPFLGDIPVIGRAFRSTSNSMVKRNLMVFIHPLILPDRASGVAISNERYNEIRDQQLRFRNRVETFLLPDALPILPELKSNTVDAPVEP